MHRRTSLIAIVTAAALALTACGGSQPKTTPKAAEPKVARIVSLSPTATEMLYAIGAGKQVVAVDDQSDYPAGVPKTDLSGLKPNAEAIASRNPDLVVVSDDTDKIVEQLKQLKIDVYVAPAAKTLDDTYAQLTELGRQTGHASEAAKTVTGMKNDVATIAKSLPQRSKKLTYYWELDPTYYSATSRTFMGSVLGLAGLTSIADSAGDDYPQLSAEAIVKANPDLIFLADTKCCQQSTATVQARPGWAEIAAVKNGRVYGLDDSVASRWGPRTVDLLRDVADAVAKVPAA
ncbi:ABC transporter substrate-binding protein [Planosporangium thailandense]|uniref:ABC transporter substrate-binding protein n=1 Tax=Planosporangium thailandense TaxID=765197 RepID=A0ABX0XTC6_9ACTN|nr:ABC transporter substrate-binding protein [Planosporangium thailandense]NJC68695.1 ABC transporter substrate-binding protein [Planosporangium thailandense]